METEDWKLDLCEYLITDKASNSWIDSHCGKPAVGITLVDKFSGTISSPRCAEHLPFRDRIPGSTLNDLSGEEL